jgi:hypothetical protein
LVQFLKMIWDILYSLNLFQNYKMFPKTILKIIVNLY